MVGYNTTLPNDVSNNLNDGVAVFQLVSLSSLQDCKKNEKRVVINKILKIFFILINLIVKKFLLFFNGINSSF